MSGIDLPTRLVFYERQKIGRIAIDLICGGKDERSIRTEFANALEHNERAGGINAEVGHRLLCGPVVTRLGGRVNDRRYVFAVPAKDIDHRLLVADVLAVISKVGKRLSELFGVPINGAIEPKEILPHIIVDTDNVTALLMKESSCLAADQTGTARDHHYTHCYLKY